MLPDIFGRIKQAFNLANVAADGEIPANTTARVWVPTSDPAGVTEGGVPAGRAAGLKFLRREADAAVFEAGSGTYRFVAAWNQAP